MKKTILTILSTALALFVASAQDHLVVESMEMATSDLEARTNPVKDANGEPCALIKVQIANITALSFPDVVQASKYENGEYKVYVPDGTRRLRFTHPNYVPGTIDFSDFNIKKVSKNTTYVVHMKAPSQITATVAEVVSQYVVFDVTPTNAVLIFDGKAIPLSDGKAQEYKPFGTYTYEVRAENYHSATGTLTVSDPNNTIQLPITLLPNFGWISVNQPAGASVYIDDKFIGNTPITSQELKSGVHHVRVTKDLFSDFEQDVQVKDNETHSVSPVLSSDFSTVVLNAVDGGEIWLNGQRKGVGRWSGNLSSGIYRAEVRKPSHRSVSQDITVPSSGKEVTFRLEDPIPVYGSLNVSSNLIDASIYIDGEYIGKTPAQIPSLLIGQHTVGLKKQGYADVEQTILIEEGKRQSISLQMTDELTVELAVQPVTADVRIDGIPVRRGNVKVTSGQHTITASAGGYAPFEQVVNLTQNGETVPVVLSRYVQISLKGTPANTQGFLNGNQLTNTTFTVTPGSYKLRLKCKGYKDFSSDFTILDGDSDKTINVSMKKKVTAGQVVGKLFTYALYGGLAYLAYIYLTSEAVEE